MAARLDAQARQSYHAEDQKARDRTGEGGEEAEKPQKKQKNYRRHVENGGDLSGMLKNTRGFWSSMKSMKS